MRVRFTTLISVGLLLSFVSHYCHGQSNPTYHAVEAAKHINETATVQDTVENVHQSKKGNIFLNMGGRYPNQLFTAFIPTASASAFPDFKQYDSKTISVTGKIALY